MLLFSSPLWLSALAPITILGVLVLRRQRSAPIAVPTLRFWPRDENSGAGRQRRVWHWLPIVLAAVLIPVTLAGPIWQPNLLPVRSIPMHAVMRAIPGTDRAELFIRINRPEWLAPESGISILSSEHEIDLNQPVLTQAVRADALADGMTFQESATDRVHVTLLAEHRSLARAELARKKNDSFSIVTQVSVPLLERALRIQPGAVSAGTAARHLLIVDAATAGDSAPAPADGDFLIALGRVPLAGVRYTGPDRTQAAAIRMAEKDDSLANVDFGDTRVRRVVPAEFDHRWRVLAHVNDQPFLAIRSASNGGNILWISSLDEDVTHWPLHPSFVVFFTNLVNSWLTHGPSLEPEWQVIPETQPTGRPAVALSHYAGGAVLLCLVVGASLLIKKHPRLPG